MNSARSFQKSSDGSKTNPLDQRQKRILVLQQALMSFRGLAPFIYLNEVYRLAVERLGFEGSLQDAAELLGEIPKVRVEIAPVLGQSRVYASAYWSLKR